MFAQGTCFVLTLLVAGVLSVPFKFRTGGDVGASGSTGISAGAGIDFDKKDGHLYGYKGSAMLGGNAKGEAHASGFGELNKNRIGGEVEVHGDVKGKVRDTIEGDVGVDSHGNIALSAVNQATASGGANGGGSVAIGTNEDAPGYKQHGGVWSKLNSDY